MIKRNWYYLICISLLAAFPAAAQSKKPHPYLYFTPHHIQHLKDRIATDTLMARVWNDMKEKADQATAGGRATGIDVLCLAYRMTGDKKYAEQAKKMLLQLTGKDAWDGMDDRTPRWNSGLATARGCFTSA